MRRWALVPVSLAMAIAIRSATPALIAQSLPAAPAIDVSAPSDALRDRMNDAARLAAVRYTEWLGAAPFDRLSIADHRPFDSPGQMHVESLVARQLAREWFARVDGHDQWKAAAAMYLQSRVVEDLFDRRFLLKAYRYDGACFFACFAPWSFRELPLTRWTAVTDRGARAFASLERELSWPTLQGALRAAAAGRSDPVAAMNLATGRDWRPLFDAAFNNAVIDHSIASMESTPATCPDPCYRTTVTLRDHGQVPLALTVRVTFADRQHVDSRWDGSTRATFAFESAAPAVSARLDPDRVLLLDRNPLDNAIVQTQATNVPVTKWMARWIVWLQDALLTNTFPV